MLDHGMDVIQGGHDLICGHGDGLVAITGRVSFPVQPLKDYLGVRGSVAEPDPCAPPGHRLWWTVDGAFSRSNISALTASSIAANPFSTAGLRCFREARARGLLKLGRALDQGRRALATIAVLGIGNAVALSYLEENNIKDRAAKVPFSGPADLMLLLSPALAAFFRLVGTLVLWRTWWTAKDFRK
jgi:hypothetical protein